jgi:hypothetical protein
MLDLQIDASSLDRLRARLAEAPALVAQQVEAGMQGAVQAVYEEVARRTPVRTGRLRETLFARVEGGGVTARGVVGFTADYARPVEEGARPHVIRPRRAKVLRFVVGGRVVFAPIVNHPGSRGAHMLREGAQAAAPRVRRIFSARLGVVTRRLAGR